MPTYEITAPDGKTLEITAPDGATQDQVLAYVQANYKPTKEQTKQAEAPITSGVLMGLKDPITAGAQMLPRGLEYISSLGGYAPNVVSRFFGSEAQRVDEMARQEEAAYQQARQARGEEGFDWERVGGNVVSPANLAVGARVGQALSMARPVVQAGVTGAVSGALMPITTPDTSFAEEKLKQTGLGAVGGAVGRAAVKGTSAVLNPIASKAEQTMRELGVTLTPGQRIGGQVKALEEFAQNMPLIGQFISNAKEKQLFQFNKGVINKALSKVDEKLPEDVIGRDAVAAANKVISDKYDDILSKINFSLDPQITNALGNVVKSSKLTSASQKQELNDLINAYIYQRIPVNNKGVGTIDGATFKGIESDILKRVRSLRASSTDAERSVGEEFGKALDVFKAAMRSQNPDKSSALRRIDSAYGDLAVMKTAAANTNAENGVFTPKQYQQAVRQRDLSRSKSAFAAGTARGQEVSDAAVEILTPPKQSTLEGRLALGAAGGYAFMSKPEVAIASAIAIPAMYSKAGLKVMEALLSKRPEIARKVGEELTKRATKEGSITGAQILEEYNRQLEAAKE